MDLGPGYDDQILAEPQLGVVSPVSDGFMSGSTHFLMRMADYKSDHRLDLAANVGGIVYGQKVEGGDTEIGMNAAYRHRLFAPLALDVLGSGNWFRRDEQANGAPVFDQDLYSTGASLGLALGKKWVVTGGGRYDWARYPGREYAPKQYPEKQTQGSVLVSGARRLGARDHVNLELYYRQLDSNVPSSQYYGPTALLRARFSLPLSMTLAPFLVYSHRSFDGYYTSADSIDTRWDDSWQYGLSLGRSISPRASVFADGSFLHQLSNVSDFEFNEARISAGFTFQLVSTQPGPTVLKQSPTRKLAPEVRPEGVRFRFKAPQARAVSVVGDWNGWNGGRNPLRGPFKGGVWEVTIPLKPGIWRYAFIVDGVWEAPPEAPRTENDGFGGVRGVLEVGGA